MEIEDKKWKILHSEYLHRRPWLTVRRDTVQLPTGVINDEYYVLEYPDWINVIAIREDGRFVMIRQYRHALGVTAYELVAGVVDPSDASPLDAAKRELYEETGYGGGRWEEYLVAAPNPGAMTNYSHTFLARGVRPVSTQHLEATEDIDVFTFTEDEVFGMLRSGQIKQALMIAPLWKYFFENR